MAQIQDLDSKYDFGKASSACEMSASGDINLGIM